MAQLTARPRLARRSPFEVVIDRIWRYFCSVRAAILEIAILAVLVLLGTLRGSEVPQWIQNGLPFTKPIIRRWYGWDVFHSLPFMTILAVLAIAIAVCTMNRAPGIWHTIDNPTVGTTHGFLKSAGTHATLEISDPIDDSNLKLSEIMSSRRYRMLTQTRGEEIHVYADKNRYAKLGTFPFHFALILILVGGIVGARYGFRNKELVIPEGSVREIGHGTGLTVGLDQFTDTYNENGMPHEYRSDLVLYQDGKQVKTGSITVNHPMTYHNVVLYQSSFGQAATLKVTDDQGHVLYDDSVPLGLYVSTANPDAPAGFIDILPANIRLNVIAPDEDLANRPELDKLRLASGEMFIQARSLDPTFSQPPASAVVSQGQSAALGPLKVQFIRERRFTLLQVSHNPGIPIFFAAALLLVGGLAITFYFPHRRVRGIFAPSPNPGTGAVLELVPLAKRDWSGRRDFYRLIEDLEERLGVKATLHTFEDRMPNPIPVQAAHSGD
ncbi:MAG: cytochrome c biogenesis protein ResB [Thermomicrobiales bacterium]